MILYFTGTGNSKYVASALADLLSDEAVSLNDIIKNGKERVFESEKPYIIVAPIYAWRLPRIIDEIVATATFNGSKKLYFVPTMGSQTGKCDMYCKDICEAAGLEFMGLRGIAMPNNYITGSKMADEKTNEAIIEKAMVQVKEVAGEIGAGREIHKTDRTPIPGLLSGTVNNMFTKYFCSAEKYVVSDACISCGLCAKLCVMNNVTMEEGKHPVFGKNCINCYACIQYCPKAAINVPGKTEKSGRYTCKEYTKA